MKKIPDNLLFFVSLFFLVSLPALAQGAPPATPIDGGLTLLLAAGGGYGLKKLNDSRKKN
ncbi:MAG: hypothetical protein ABJG41_02420 [Cyclobacteriaceae bacterium]